MRFANLAHATPQLSSWNLSPQPTWWQLEAFLAKPLNHVVPQCLFSRSFCERMLHVVFTRRSAIFLQATLPSKRTSLPLKDELQEQNPPQILRSNSSHVPMRTGDLGPTSNAPCTRIRPTVRWERTLIGEGRREAGRRGCAADQL